jgi:hypothetical protein
VVNVRLCVSLMGYCLNAYSFISEGVHGLEPTAS